MGRNCLGTVVSIGKLTAGHGEKIVGRRGENGCGRGFGVGVWRCVFDVRVSVWLEGLGGNGL